eukprot:1150389-Pelagomonas_calceolata.AAC.2
MKLPGWSCAAPYLFITSCTAEIPIVGAAGVASNLIRNTGVKEVWRHYMIKDLLSDVQAMLGRTNIDESEKGGEKGGEKQVRKGIIGIRRRQEIGKASCRDEEVRLEMQESWKRRTLKDKGANVWHRVSYLDDSTGHKDVSQEKAKREPLA